MKSLLSLFLLYLSIYSIDLSAATFTVTQSTDDPNAPWMYASWSSAPKTLRNAIHFSNQDITPDGSHTIQIETDIIISEYNTANLNSTGQLLIQDQVTIEGGGHTITLENSATAKQRTDNRAFFLASYLEGRSPGGTVINDLIIDGFYQGIATGQGTSGNQDNLAFNNVEVVNCYDNGFLLEQASDVYLNTTISEGNGKHGVQILSCSELTIEGCEINSNVGDGISLGPKTQYDYIGEITISNSLIYDNGNGSTSDIGRGIYASKVENIKIINNSIYDNLYSGIFLSPGSSNYSYSVNIESNHIYDNGYGGFNNGQTHGVILYLVTGATIDDNIIENNEGSGILILESEQINIGSKSSNKISSNLHGIGLLNSATNIVVENNEIFSHKGTTELGSGILLDGGYQSDIAEIDILNNSIYKNDNGIIANQSVYGKIQDLNISNNIIGSEFQNDLGNLMNGILISSTIENLNIEENIISNNHQNGILFNVTTDQNNTTYSGTVDGNSIQYNTENGLQLTSKTTLIEVGNNSKNIISDNGSNGILLEGSVSEISINNNEISNHQSDDSNLSGSGILLKPSKNDTISKITISDNVISNNIIGISSPEIRNIGSLTNVSILRNNMGVNEYGLLDNGLYHSTQNGISIKSFVQGLFIDENIIIGSLEYGILISNQPELSTGLFLNRNYIGVDKNFNFTKYPEGDIGIHLENISDVILNENIITNNFTNGINILSCSNVSSESDFIGTTINYDAVGNGLNGVYVDNSSDVRLDNCTIANSENGISAYDSDISISNSTINNNTLNGFLSRNTSINSFTKNEVSNNGTGIRLDLLSSSEIYDNNIYCNSEIGIYIDETEQDIFKEIEPPTFSGNTLLINSDLPNQKIEVYKNTSCEMCQAEEIIATGYTDNNGVFELDITPFTSTESRFNYSIIQNGITYPFSDCANPILSTLKDTKQNSNLLAYPNPFTNTIKITKNVENIRLIDISGKEVLKTEKSSIDTSDLPEGIYFIEFTSKGITKREKVIKL